VCSKNNDLPIGYVIQRRYGLPYRRVWIACFLTLLLPAAVRAVDNLTCILRLHYTASTPFAWRLGRTILRQPPTQHTATPSILTYRHTIILCYNPFYTAGYLVSTGSQSGWLFFEFLNSCQNCRSLLRRRKTNTATNCSTN
jgi:hypothetical protein